MRKNYVQEILNSIHGNIPHAELAEKRSDYHEKDLADALEDLDGIDKDEIVNQLDRDSLEERIVQSYPYVTDREKSAIASSALWTMRNAPCHRNSRFLIRWQQP